MTTAKSLSQSSDTEARRREAATGGKFSAEERIDLKKVSSFSAKPPSVSKVSTRAPAFKRLSIRDCLNSDGPMRTRLVSDAGVSAWRRCCARGVEVRKKQRRMAENVNTYPTLIRGLRLGNEGGESRLPVVPCISWISEREPKPAAPHTGARLSIAEPYSFLRPIRSGRIAPGFRFVCPGIS